MPRQSVNVEKAKVVSTINSVMIMCRTRFDGNLVTKNALSRTCKTERGKKKCSVKYVAVT